MLALLLASALAAEPTLAELEEGAIEGGALTVAQLEAACERGDVRACHRAARRYHQATYGVSNDPVKAEALYERACRAGLHVDCGFAAWYHVDAVPDVVKAAALATIGCGHDDVGSCFALGHLQLLGAGVPRNAEQGMARLKAGCDAGIPEACADLGLAWAGFVQDVPAEPERAAPLLEKACDDGHAAACGALGTLALQGRVPGKDAVAGRAWVARACDAGEPYGCEQLAAARLQGLGGPIDVAGAVGPLGRACDAGRAASCRELSAMAMEGRGMAADRAKAIAIGKQGCAAGDKPLCDELARACDAGATDACR